jgi:hypothetical protein
LGERGGGNDANPAASRIHNHPQERWSRYAFRKAEPDTVIDGDVPEHPDRENELQ